MYWGILTKHNWMQYDIQDSNSTKDINGKTCEIWIACCLVYSIDVNFLVLINVPCLYKMLIRKNPPDYLAVLLEIYNHFKIIVKKEWLNISWRNYVWQQHSYPNIQPFSVKQHFTSFNDQKVGFSACFLASTVKQSETLPCSTLNISWN